MVITRLEIENFKAIKKLAIDLDPLTVLVGPNDSGKSTILQALELLSRSLDRPVQEASDAHGPLMFDGDPTEAIHGGDHGKVIRLALKWMGGGYEVTFGLRGRAFVVLSEECNDPGLKFSMASGTGQQVTSLPGFPIWTGHRTLLQMHLEALPRETANIRDRLTSFLIAFEPGELARPCGADEPFQSTGRGLVSLVDRMLTDTDRSARDDYEAALRAFSKHVVGIGARPAKGLGPVKELLFGIPGHVKVPASAASTGLLLVAGYLALRYLPRQRLLVEEPENGVHPRALLQIADAVRSLATAERPVVMTTHSPILLNYLDPANVRVITRSPTDGVQVTAALDSKAFDEVSQDVDFGELWYTLGDESLAAMSR